MSDQEVTKTTAFPEVVIIKEQRGRSFTIKGVIVEGIDLSGWVSSIAIDFSAIDMPVITLEIHPGDIRIVREGVEPGKKKQTLTVDTLGGESQELEVDQERIDQMMNLKKNNNAVMLNHLWPLLQANVCWL